MVICPITDVSFIVRLWVISHTPHVDHGRKTWANIFTSSALDASRLDKPLLLSFNKRLKK
jgi:hypothetical protein